MRLRPARGPRSRIQLRGERARDARSGLPAERAADELAGAKQLLEIDAGVDAQAVEHVDHVFGGDVAGGSLRVGAASQSRDRAVESLHPQLERGIDVGERLAVGVVIVPADPGHGDLAGDRLDHGTDLLRRADAYGVAQRDLVAAHAVKLAGEQRHRGGPDLSFVGAARDDRDVAANAYSARFGRLDDGREALQALADRAVDVLAAEGLGRGAEYRDLLCARRTRGLETFHVGNQHGVGDARALPDPGHHLGVIRHLWHP